MNAAAEQWEFDCAAEFLEELLKPGLPQAISPLWLSEHVAGALRKNQTLAEALRRAVNEEPL